MHGHLNVKLHLFRCIWWWTYWLWKGTNTIKLTRRIILNVTQVPWLAGDEKRIARRRNDSARWHAASQMVSEHEERVPFHVNAGKAGFRTQDVLTDSFVRVLVHEVISGQHVRIVNGTACTITPAVDLVSFLQFYQETRDLNTIIFIHQHMRTIDIK